MPDSLPGLPQSIPPGQVHHVVSVSGGKDSTALVLLAVEVLSARGIVPILVFADTGHEHPLTYAYLDILEAHLGLPIHRVRRDFADDMARKRRFIREKWPQDGVPADRVARALELLHPTGVPYLDLCMMKGRFPSTKVQFCTEFLKAQPIYEAIMLPLMRTGRVLSWQGIRADESARRAKMPRYERGDGRMWFYRPLLRWSVDQVFEQHRRHGVEPNPLYKQGMGRVGCMPCIHARKSELRAIAERYPDEVQRVAEWESLVSQCNKKGTASFFAADKSVGAHSVDKDLPAPRIAEVMEWAKTSRGGTQYDLEAMLPVPQCSSIYGLCE